MGVNDYFSLIKTNRPHETNDYWPKQSRFEFDYYRYKYCFPENCLHTRKIRKYGKEVIYSLKKSILTLWSFLVITHMTNYYRHQVKVSEIQIKSAHK